MAMNAEELKGWRDACEIEAEHLRAVLAQPNDYFSPKGGQHWYQVTSRSEIEARLAGQLRLVDHVNKQLGGAQ